MMPRKIRVVRDRREWWADAGEFATAPGKRIIFRARVVAVDPANTSPNVVVAVRTDPEAPAIFLRPGESVTFPEKVDSLWVCNPLAVSQVGMNVAGDWLAAVALLAGDTTDLVAWRARANRTRPTPHARIIAAGPLDSSEATLAVVTDGLEGIRVRVFCRDVANAAMVTPADFAGTLRITHALRIPILASGEFDLDTFATYDPETNRPGAPVVGYFIDGVDASSDFALTPDQTVADYQVGVGSRAAISILGLAGTDVASLYAIVEGV